MAKRELKFHFVPAGQKVWTICGRQVKTRMRQQDWPFTSDPARVTCGCCKKLMAGMESKTECHAETQRRGVDERVIVHFADKTDLEIGTSKCGASLKNARAAGQMELVTCERCGGKQKEEVKPVFVVHMGKEPVAGESALPQALLCGAEYTVGSRTDNARMCTCPDCLRLMADGWARKYGGANARAELYEKQANEFKAFSQDAVRRANLECEQKEIAENSVTSLSKSLNDATVRYQYAEAQNSVLHGELESIKNERGVLREEVRRWKAAASVSLALNAELFSCTSLR